MGGLGRPSKNNHSEHGLIDLPGWPANPGGSSQGTTGNSRNRGTGQESNLPKATQLGKAGTGIQTQASGRLHTLAQHGGWGGVSCGVEGWLQGTEWGGGQTADILGGGEWSVPGD